jgi:putative ATP-binding cassette transporter
MQINSAFGNVQENFQLVHQRVLWLASWRATSDRLLSFHQAMSENEQRSPAIDVRPEGERLMMQGLGMDLADGRHLLTGADMTVEPGQRLMLSGRSGSGKSTLLRAMGHLWPAGHGNIRLPAARYLFLPQKPYLPIGTLKDVLSYPQDDSVYPAQRYAQVLKPAACPIWSRAWTKPTTGNACLAGRATASGLCPRVAVRAAVAVYGRSHVGHG